jgi:hypothetical protein
MCPRKEKLIDLDAKTADRRPEYDKQSEQTCSSFARILKTTLTSSGMESGKHNHPWKSLNYFQIVGFTPS